MSKKNLPATYDQLMQGYAQHMVAEIYRYLEARRVTNGDKFVDGTMSEFISALICAVLFNELKKNAETPNVDNKEKLELAIKGFAISKLVIQESVAKGFQDAMSAFVGRQVEYYCQVNPIPEAKSTLIN